jgi:hypothetical protein
MRHTAVLVKGVLIGAAFASPCRTVSAQVPASSVATPPPVRDLLIDPLMLSSVKEYRNIIASVGAEIFPEWKANSSAPSLVPAPHARVTDRGAEAASGVLRAHVADASLLARRDYLRAE